VTTVAEMPLQTSVTNVYPKPQSQDLAVLSRDLEGYHAFMESMNPQVNVVVLDLFQDGITQITNVLKYLPSIRCIHFVTPGTPGCLHLGNAPLNNANMPCYASALHHWRSHLTQDAAIVIYNPQVASNEAGKLLIDVLHHLTGAAIAASAASHLSSPVSICWEFDCTTAPFTPALVFPPSLIRRFHTTCLNHLDDTPLSTIVLQFKNTIRKKRIAV